MKTPSPLRLCFALTIFLAAKTSAELTIAPVALSGQPAPEVAGSSFGEFSDMQINDRGQVLFIGSLARNGGDGLWTGWADDLRLVARTGVQAPGYADGIKFFFLGKPVLCEDGASAFYARLEGPGISTDAFEPGNDDTVWAGYESPATARVLQQTGRPLPSPRVLIQIYESGRRSHDLRQVCFAYKGFFLWYYVLGLTTGEEQYWKRADFLDRRLTMFARAKKERSLIEQADGLGPVDQSGGNLGLIGVNFTPAASSIAVVGDPATGTTESYLSIEGASFAATRTGTVAFVARIPSGNGIWLGPGENPRPVALPGMLLPASLAAELGPDARLVDLFGSSLGLNARGQVAFVGTVQAPGKPSQTALISGSPGRFRLVARARRTLEEEGFIAFDQLVLNAAGDVALVGTHSSLPPVASNPISRRGLWFTHQHGPPVLMLAEGNTAPGLKEGEVINFFGLPGPFMNVRGQVLMGAEIGPALGFEHRQDHGIWLFDPERGVQLVARGGTQIDIGAGQTRILQPLGVSFASTHEVSQSGGEDGRVRPLNRLGQVVFLGRWQESDGTSRSGVFIAGDVRLLGGRRIGDDIEVAFPTAVGKRYQVEYRNHAEAGEWTRLRAEVAGTGGLAIVTDPGAAKLPERFYRAVLSP